MVPKYFSLLFLGVGVFLLMQVLLPPLAFQIWAATSLNKDTLLVNPSPGENVLGVSVSNSSDFPGFISETVPANLPYTEFSLSIPKIKVQSAEVKVASTDIDNSLIQLAGSALPGEKGNVFISGHSSLPIFFKDNNYKAIFSNLPTLEKGDQIQVRALGQEFNYVVENLKVVDVSDTSVINPPDKEGRFLSLMTCVPPGLTLKRLIVLAKLR